MTTSPPRDNPQFLGNNWVPYNHLTGRQSPCVTSEPVSSPEYCGGKSGHYQVIWPLHRADYLTMWDGYQVSFAGWISPQRHTGLSRHRFTGLLASAGLPSELVLRNREVPRHTKSFRVFRVAPPDKLAARIEQWIEKSQKLAGVSDVSAAAMRAALTDVARPLPILGHMVYREKHKPQTNYRGSGSPRAKLTDGQVKTIRQLYHSREFRKMRRTGKVGASYAALAKRFKVSATAIMNIVKGATWRTTVKAPYRRVYGETRDDVIHKPCSPTFELRGRRRSH